MIHLVTELSVLKDASSLFFHFLSCSSVSLRYFGFEHYRTAQMMLKIGEKRREEKRRDETRQVETRQDMNQ